MVEILVAALAAGAAGEVTGEAVAVELALFGSVLRKIHGSAPIRNFVA